MKVGDIVYWTPRVFDTDINDYKLGDDRYGTVVKLAKRQSRCRIWNVLVHHTGKIGTFHEPTLRLVK
jgi:hypothetical protein